MVDFTLQNQIDKFKAKGFDFSDIGYIADYKLLRQLYDLMDTQNIKHKLSMFEQVCKSKSATNESKADFLEIIAYKNFDGMELTQIADIATAGYRTNIVEEWFDITRLNTFYNFNKNSYPLNLVCDKTIPTELLYIIPNFYKAGLDPLDFIKPETNPAVANIICRAASIDKIDLSEYNIGFDVDQITVIREIKLAEKEGYFIDPKIINSSFPNFKMDCFLWACKNNVDWHLFDEFNDDEIYYLNSFLKARLKEADIYLNMIFNNVSKEKIADLTHALFNFNFPIKSYEEDTKSIIKLFNEYNGDKAAVLYNCYKNELDVERLCQIEDLNKLILSSELERFNILEYNIPDTNFENMYFYTLSLFYNQIKHNDKIKDIDANVFLHLEPNKCKETFINNVIETLIPVTYRTLETNFDSNYYDGPEEIEFQDGTIAYITTEDELPWDDIFGTATEEEDLSNFVTQYEKQIRTMIMANLIPKIGFDEKYSFNNNEILGPYTGFEPIYNLYEQSDLILDDMTSNDYLADIDIDMDLKEFLEFNGLNLNNYAPSFKYYDMCYNEYFTYGLDDILKEYGEITPDTIKQAQNLFEWQCKMIEAFEEGRLYMIHFDYPDGEQEVFGGLFAEDLEQLIQEKMLQIESKEQSTTQTDTSRLGLENDR